MLSLQTALNGSYGFGVQDTTIFMFEPNSKFFRARYYGQDGLSGGCAVVTKIKPTGEVLVVRVQVPLYDTTIERSSIEPVSKRVALQPVIVFQKTVKLTQRMYIVTLHLD